MDIKKLSTSALQTLKQTLRDLKPTNEAAVKWISMKSLVNSKDGEAYTKVCVNRLQECKECEDIEIDGFRLKLVVQKKKVYNPSDRITEAEEQIALWKEKLQRAQDEAGFEEVEGNVYYRTV